MISTNAAARWKVVTAGAGHSGQMRSVVGGEGVSTPGVGGQKVGPIFGVGFVAGVDFDFDVCAGVCWQKWHGRGTRVFLLFVPQVNFAAP